MLAPILLTLFVAAPEVELDRTGSPHFLVEGTGNVSALPLRETSAKVAIAGVIARVRVTQVYQNESSQPIEAVYVFPGSTRSAVFGMQMKIGARTIDAKIEKREAARQMYERAVNEGKSASLLEQHRPNVFSMRVGNIMPGDRIEVSLDYTELLRPVDGVYELVYPTVVGPRYTGSGKEAESWTENPHLGPSLKPTYKWSASVRLAAGLPIAALDSPTHTISPRFDGKNTAVIETDEEHGGNRDFVLRYRLAGDAIETGLLLFENPQEKDDNYFLLMAHPPKREVPRAPVGREYIFVLDVSGSMNGFPLNTAKTLLRGLLGGMKSEDRFNILFFSGGSAVLGEKSISATEENMTIALEMIDRTRGGGGTEILAALNRALAMPRAPQMSTTIAVLTDGYVMVESETYRLIRNNLGSANLFAFGIGNAVNRAIIEGMSRAGMGEPFFALNEREAEQQAEKFTKYVESPLLSNVRVEFSGFDAYDVEPPALPDLFASRPLLMFGKYRGEASGKIVLRGNDAGGDYERNIRVADIEPSDDLVALRYLWARDRIGRLSDDFALTGAPELAQQITALGLKHRLMTEHTSFVAIDSQVRNHSKDRKTVVQPLPAPAGMDEGHFGKLGTRGTGRGGGGAAIAGNRLLKSGATGDSFGMGGLGTHGHGKGTGGYGVKVERNVQVQAGSPIVMGSLDKNIIRRAIDKQRARVRYCYEKALTKNPLLEGKVVISFTITPDGSVTAVLIRETTLGDADVEACIATVMKELTYPAPAGGGAVIVNYPFVFKTSK
jgi:Ca-activated chloride channel family protein